MLPDMKTWQNEQWDKIDRCATAVSGDQRDLLMHVVSCPVIH